MNVDTPVTPLGNAISEHSFATHELIDELFGKEPEQSGVEVCTSRERLLDAHCQGTIPVSTGDVGSASSPNAEKSKGHSPAAVTMSGSWRD